MSKLQLALAAVAAQIDALNGRRGATASGEALLPIGLALLALQAQMGQPALEAALVDLAVSARQANRLMTVAQTMDIPAGRAVLGHMCGLSKLATLATLDAAELQELASGACLRGLDLAKMGGMTARELANALATITAPERAMLIEYRRCDDAARQHLHTAAQLLARHC